MSNKKTSVIMTVIVITLIIILVLILLIGDKKSQKQISQENLLNINYEIEGNEINLLQYETTNPLVALYIKNYGSIVIELYPKIAPNTVNNFISLVKKGFYDNNTFHRLVPGFVLQGGDPNGTGIGGPGYHIKGEFSSNNYKNDLKHEKKVVSMARSQDYNSAGSQFFIMLEDASHLDGEYAAFGKVIDGWENVEKIVSQEKIIDEQTGKLHTNLTIKKAAVDLKEKTYEEVEKID